MQSIYAAYCYRWICEVCLFVCQLVTTVSSAEMAEPIKILFEWQTCVGPVIHVLDGAPIS